MKKFKSIKQLQTEKMRLIQQQEKLENKIRSNWNELKECLKPVNIAKDIFSKVIKNKTEQNLNGESILKSTFTYGVTLLAKRLLDKAEEKLDKFCRK